jgi:hypothetical protein
LTGCCLPARSRTGVRELKIEYRISDIEERVRQEIRDQNRKKDRKKV